MNDLQAAIAKLEAAIEENKAMLEQIKLELSLFEQQALTDQYGTVIAVVNCHI